MVSIKNVGLLALCAAATAWAQPQPFQPPKDAKALLSDLHQTNQKEIQLAKQAQQKAISPQTRQYAQQLIQDHQQLDQQVLQLSKQMNVSLGEVSPRGNLEKSIHAASNNIDSALQNAQGSTWDTLFLSNQLIAHHSKVQMLQAAQVKFQDQPQLSQLVTKALPIMAHHQHMAVQALSQVVGQDQAVGGAGMQGVPQPEQPSPSGY